MEQFKIKETIIVDRHEYHVVLKEAVSPDVYNITVRALKWFTGDKHPERIQFVNTNPPEFKRL